MIMDEVKAASLFIQMIRRMFQVPVYLSNKGGKIVTWWVIGQDANNGDMRVYGFTGRTTLKHGGNQGHLYVLIRKRR
jgi:hypothetical protein